MGATLIGNLANKRLRRLRSQAALAKQKEAEALAKLPKPQEGKQSEFYHSKAEITIYGGAAGGGKSFCLLMKAAKHYKVPGYGAVLFRRTSPEITNQGGLWDESKRVYSHYPGARDRESKLDWVWKEGSAVSFGHGQYEKDIFDKYPGAQIPYIGFDELTKFTENQFWFLFSRNRTTCGVKPRIDATCNPDADSWLVVGKDGWGSGLISWWIDPETGYPIEERSGVIRYFYRKEEKIIWGDTSEELEDQFFEIFPEMQKAIPPKSITFISSSVDDNQELLNQNPEYKANLLSLHPIEMERLLKGNWKIKAESGKVFNRNWITYVTEDQLPKWGYMEIRGWDMAATAKEKDDSACYTAGIKLMYRYSDGMVIITGMYAEQIDAGQVLDAIADTAMQDGPKCLVRWELEGGSAGPIVERALRKKLQAFNGKGVRPEGDKLTRALPVANAMKMGKIAVLEGPWNAQLVAWLHNFDGVSKVGRDAVDALSLAYNLLLAMSSSSWLKKQ